MGMDSTVNINTEHVHSIQVSANNLEETIQDGASAVSDDSVSFYSL